MAPERRREYPIEYSKTSTYLSEERYKYLISLIEAKECTSSVHSLYPGLKWVMFGNKVYDITGLDHPGGQYIWEKLNARDIARFFAGNYRFEDIDDASIMHTHTVNAYNYLDRRYIGSIDKNPIIFERIEFENNTFLEGIQDFTMVQEAERLVSKNQEPENINEISFQWSLVGWKSISENISVFYFESDSKIVKSQPIQFNNFGRYFQMRYKTGYYKNNFRMYTLVASMLPENLNWRRKIRRFFENLEGNIPNDFHLIPPPDKSEYLPFVIKRKKDKHSISNILHTMVEKNEARNNNHGDREEEEVKLLVLDSPKNAEQLAIEDEDSQYMSEESAAIYKENMFYFDGPLGMGLNLRKYDTGDIYCFCEGTGELPFLDLLDFIYKKLLQRAFHVKFPEEAVKFIDPFDSEYDISLENDIMFTFYITVEDIADSLATPLLNEILDFQLKYTGLMLVARAQVITSEIPPSLEEAFPHITFTHSQVSREALSQHILRDEPINYLLSGCSDYCSFMKTEIGGVDKSILDKVFVV